ncbi:MAG: AAA family ATPase [Gallionella sp.]|nr:AAA family ATPase [Gallionella sp.]
MYLEHFGLSEPPFRITPITEFFFSGAHRGEMLDALIYSLNEAEGIIKVSGEVGSGKTMICRMLLERLPKYIEPVYLANPSLTREEMLYAIADALGLNVQNERVGIIMHSIQSKLEEKVHAGKRVVVLVDEAHAMPLETLEELRLLYNLQIGDTKLLQIILFGQPELNAKLEQPNMRQLKDRIVHHFHVQPLSRNILENYLMFRMRAAGYHGPNIFSPQAIKLISAASQGLMRRVNILADKSLLAAFVDDSHSIEPRHVEAAMRDSEIGIVRRLPDKKWLIGGGAVSAAVLTGVFVWTTLIMPVAKNDSMPEPVMPTDTSQVLPEVGGTPVQVTVVAPTPAPITPPAPVMQPMQVASVAPQPAVEPVASAQTNPPPSDLRLYEQRMLASKRMRAGGGAVASIQLFYNEKNQPERIESFLRRAAELGKLSDIYLLPIRTAGQDGMRVLYGAYPSVESARAAVKDLPSRYQESFATSIYVY